MKPAALLTRRQILKAAGAGGALVILGPLGCSSTGAGTDLIQRQEMPYNAEPRLDALPEAWVPPIRHFYFRSHGPVPQVDASTYRLQIGGMVERPLRLSLDELRASPQGEAPATLQCAGNRRLELIRIKKGIPGVAWDAGAIGNADWRGAKLSELLKRAGVKSGASYVWFEGIDEPVVAGKKIHFAAMIPLEKAMRPETLVALEMNGEPLPPSHGAPARALIPGYIGARSVKWLSSITVADRPSDAHYASHDYKLFPPDVTDETAKWDEQAPIFENLLSSVICSPAPNQAVKAGRITLRGWALAPGGVGGAVAKVEVSADGSTWKVARFVGKESAFAWRLWEAEVEVAPGARVLTVRATDQSGRLQPEKSAWNFKGYLANGWHQVPITVG